jgi:hypothetical protein
MDFGVEIVESRPTWGLDEPRLTECYLPFVY